MDLMTVAKRRYFILNFLFLPNLKFSKEASRCPLIQYETAKCRQYQNPHLSNAFHKMEYQFT